jgi:hypothetical protein
MTRWLICELNSSVFVISNSIVITSHLLNILRFAFQSVNVCESCNLSGWQFLIKIFLFDAFRISIFFRDPKRTSCKWHFQYFSTLSQIFVLENNSFSSSQSSPRVRETKDYSNARSSTFRWFLRYPSKHAQQKNSSRRETKNNILTLLFKCKQKEHKHKHRGYCNWIGSTGSWSCACEVFFNWKNCTMF